MGRLLTNPGLPPDTGGKTKAEDLV